MWIFHVKSCLSWFHGQLDGMLPQPGNYGICIETTLIHVQGQRLWSDPFEAHRKNRFGDHEAIVDLSQNSKSLIFFTFPSIIFTDFCRAMTSPDLSLRLVCDHGGRFACMPISKVCQHSSRVPTGHEHATDKKFVAHRSCKAKSLNGARLTGHQPWVHMQFQLFWIKFAVRWVILHFTNDISRMFQVGQQSPSMSTVHQLSTNNVNNDV